jgi:hypothetical protein
MEQSKFDGENISEYLNRAQEALKTEKDHFEKRIEGLTTELKKKIKDNNILYAKNEKHKKNMKVC